MVPVKGVAVVASSSSTDLNITSPLPAAMQYKVTNLKQLMQQQVKHSSLVTSSDQEHVLLKPSMQPSKYYLDLPNLTLYDAPASLVEYTFNLCCCATCPSCLGWPPWPPYSSPLRLTGAATAVGAANAVWDLWTYPCTMCMWYPTHHACETAVSEVQSCLYVMCAEECKLLLWNLSACVVVLVGETPWCVYMSLHNTHTPTHTSCSSSSSSSSSHSTHFLLAHHSPCDVYTEASAFLTQPSKEHSMMFCWKPESYTSHTTLLKILTEPGWLYRHSRARNAQTYDYDHSYLQGVKLSGAKALRQAYAVKKYMPGTCSSPTRGPSCVVELMHLSPGHKGRTRHIGMKTTSPIGVPEVAPSHHSSTSPLTAFVLVINFYHFCQFFIRFLSHHANLNHVKVSNYGWVICLIFLLYIPVCTAPDPNQRTDYDNLAGMTEWNGIPHHDFLLNWFMALGTALASIVQDGYSLYQCALGEDAAQRDSADNAEQEKYKNRNARLAACILKYIKVGTHIYIYLKTQVLSDGVKMYKYIKHVGLLKRTPKQWEALRDEWDRADMHKVGIKYDDLAIFKWRDWCQTKGTVLNKDPAQLRTKFMEGFPSGFDSAIMPDRMSADGLYKQPATYPEHHPKYTGVAATNNNPDAGKFDIDLAAHSLYPEWSRRINLGLIRQVPRGMVNAVATIDTEIAEDDTDDQYAHIPSDSVSAAANAAASATANALTQTLFPTYNEMIDDLSEDDADKSEVLHAVKTGATRKIGPDDICGACGGRGHFSTVAGKKCLTIILGNKIPRDEMLQTKYPRNLKYPNFKPNRGSASASASASSAHKGRVRSFRPKSPKRPHPGKNKGKGKVRVAETANEAQSESSNHSESDDELIEESGNLVASMSVEYDKIDVHPEWTGFKYPPS